MLIKSPCRECINKKLPDCIEGCKILGDIQTVIKEEERCGENFTANSDPREGFRVAHKSASGKTDP